MRILVIVAVCWWRLVPLHGQDVLPAGEAKAAEHAICDAHSVAVAADSLVVAFFKAAAYYPELCTTNIRLQYGAVKTSMAAQPVLWSVIFRKRDRRKYRIIINKNERSAQARLLHAASFNASVGVMGHELAHILDYSTQSGWKMIWTGIRYLGRKYRRNMERQTDSTAIARGLGKQLYEYAHYVIYHADIEEDYRNYKLEYYMKPEEIHDMMIKRQ
jgi:uncharacterized membrane protein